MRVTTFLRRSSQTLLVHFDASYPASRTDPGPESGHLWVVLFTSGNFLWPHINPKVIPTGWPASQPASGQSPAEWERTRPSHSRGGGNSAALDNRNSSSVIRMRLDPGRKSGWIRAWSIYLFTIQAAAELQAECWCWFWLQESSLPAAVFIVITIVARFLGGTRAKKNIHRVVNSATRIRIILIQFSGLHWA